MHICKKWIYSRTIYKEKDKINLKKEYIAIVNGIVNDKHGIIEKPISRKNDSIILREVNKDGEYAKTEYFLYENNYSKNYSVLNVILHTGRTHQIRVHMASIGHVLLGDTLYAEEFELKDINKLIERQALHSYKISFYHPISNKYISLTCNVPDDMKNLM